MPDRTTKAMYPAVASVITAVSIIGMISLALRPLIPKSTSPQISEGPFEYLAAGETQEIRWRELNDETMAEAKRTDRLIILVIGDSASAAARFADQYWFQDRDVVDRLNGQMIPIRVDIGQMPMMACAIQPYVRSQIGFDPMFQVWFVDPQGHVVDSIPIVNSIRMQQPNWFMKKMAVIQENYVRERKEGNVPDLQASEAAAMEAPMEEPNFADHLAFLQRSVDTVNGSIDFQGRKSMRPNAWRFLMMSGDESSLESSLGKALSSPLVDWIDGGFFRQSDGMSYRDVETDKLATNNAEMIATIAMANQVHAQPTWVPIAQRTFDMMFDSMRHGPSIRAYRVGDNSSFLRSPRSALAVHEVRDQFDEDERAILRDKLGLRYETNPQMLVRIPNLSDSLEPKVLDVLEKLQKYKSSVPVTYAGEQRLDITASCYARLIEGARRLNDADRLQRAVVAAAQLASFRSGENDVMRLRDFAHSPEPCLRDYLAYSDTLLQQYIAIGRIDALIDGRAVLRRAIERFHAEPLGNLIEGDMPLELSSISGTPSANITDDLGESSIAMAIRLCLLYGRLESVLQLPAPSPSEYSGDLSQFSRMIARRFGPIVNQVQGRVSGLFAAALLASQPGCIVVTGPNCGEMQRAIEHRMPQAVVVPIFGSAMVRQPFAAAGAYTVRGSQISGPTDVETAIARLNQP